MFTVFHKIKENRHERTVSLLFIRSQSILLISCSSIPPPHPTLVSPPPTPRMHLHKSVFLLSQSLPYRAWHFIKLFPSSQYVNVVLAIQSAPKCFAPRSISAQLNATCLKGGGEGECKAGKDQDSSRQEIGLIRGIPACAKTVLEYPRTIRRKLSSMSVLSFGKGTGGQTRVGGWDYLRFQYLPIFTLTVSTNGE